MQLYWGKWSGFVCCRHRILCVLWPSPALWLSPCQVWWLDSNRQLIARVCGVQSLCCTHRCGRLLLCVLLR